jgi:hypothetical protein
MCKSVESEIGNVKALLGDFRPVNGRHPANPQ